MATERQLRDMGLDLDRIREYSLRADVGNPFDEDGLTRVELQGTGRVVVEQHRGAAEVPEQKAAGQQLPDATAVTRRHEDDIGAQTARDLIVRSAAFPWSQRFPTRPGIPSEPVLEWTLRGERSSERAVRVWLRDAEKDAAMGPVLAALRQAVERLSRGELFL